MEILENFAVLVLIGMGVLVIIVFCILYFGRLDEDEYYVYDHYDNQVEDKIADVTCRYYKGMIKCIEREQNTKN